MNDSIRSAMLERLPRDPETLPMAPTISEIPIDTRSEWLEADGLGGFASGTSAGVPTRRYHALLLAAARPPADRRVLVNGFVAWLETPQGPQALTRHHYAPGVTTEAAQIERFRLDPWPCTHYVTPHGLRVSQEIIVERGSPSVLVRFRLETEVANVSLCVRPLLSGRDFHALQRENAAFRFEPVRRGGGLLEWCTYDGMPSVQSYTNGSYEHAPEWYRNLRYVEESARGLDCDEDLAAPGILRFDLSAGDAIWLLCAGTPRARQVTETNGEASARELIERERARRARFSSPLERSAEAYLVERGASETIIAGYPWFGDWGRDTFIALRGLCLATERLATARNILVGWASVVSEGMLPNRFPDQSGEAPEYNSVDASLWFVIAASELMNHHAAGPVLSEVDRRVLADAIRQIIRGYARGTRFGIGLDEDGLLRAGQLGSQLTWMDAKVGDYVVTPRSGKVVEIQALWLNALHAAGQISPEFGALFAQGRLSFEKRFWNSEAGALYDVVDVDGQAGAVDATIRPNQVFAAGGLPVTLLDPIRARRVLDVVEDELWTPLGLRSLSPRAPAYTPRYQGGVWERDTAYHQGTVWPWLVGPFVEAWVKSRGGDLEAKREARRRFLVPIEAHLARAGLGHISEIADAEAPHVPRGCPFQAWSLSEYLRLELGVLRG